MRSIRKNILFWGFIFYGSSLFAQQTITLDDAIRIAQSNSFDAQLARFSFLSSYWAYKSYRAELLPSINLSGGLMNFNHSCVEARSLKNTKKQKGCIRKVSRI